MSESPPRTILERLENAEELPETSARAAEDRLLESIRQSLQRILNTPRGFSPSSPELGLGELIDATLTTRSMGKIEGELRRTIERFEPRITDVRVSYVPQPRAALDAALRRPRAHPGRQPGARGDVPDPHRPAEAHAGEP